MFIPEYDNATGLPSYWGVARPGSSSSSPVWRIIKWLWSGNTGAGFLWADGNGNLDNVWNDRTALSYSASPLLALEPGAPGSGWAGFFAEDIEPALPGSSFNLGFTLPEGTTPWRDTTPMVRVVTPTGSNEFALSGSTVIVGATVQLGSKFVVRVPLA